MSITIGDDYVFEGPFHDTSSLKNQSGVYVILDKRSDDKHYLLDVGESGDVGDRVENHDRKDCWIKNQKGTLYCAAYYVNEASRHRIEQDIRQRRPAIPCGER